MKELIAGIGILGYALLFILFFSSIYFSATWLIVHFGLYAAVPIGILGIGFIAWFIGWMTHEDSIS